MDMFLYFVLYFSIYAFFGWVWEFVYIFLTLHRFHWRGFLHVPLLPIYGFSAVAILLFVQPYISNPFLVFVAGAFVVTVIEFFTGLVLDKVFHLRLWDYRDLPLNVGGYTDAYTSLGFGMLGLFLVYVLQPWVTSGVTSLSHTALVWTGWILVAVIVIDFVNSLLGVIRTSIEKSRQNGTLDDIERRLDAQWLKLKNKPVSLQKAFIGWERYNLKQLRLGFPEAEVTNKQQL